MKKIIAMILAASLLLSSKTYIEANESPVPQYMQYIEEISSMYGIAPELIESIVIQESRWDVCAVGTDGAGSIGLMQIIPRYHEERMARLGVTDLTDAYSNILVGTDYLAELAQTYDVYGAVTAYNAGAGSKALKNVLNGGTWDYTDEVLERAEALERQHGK